MNIAVIPARGGSKRIPRKNIKTFHGKPMIAYSIETAIKSGCFDRVIVSTDDEEIAEVSRQYGAQTPFIRPPDLSDDYANTSDVMAHAIQHLLDESKTTGIDIEYLCCIYATAPFMRAIDLQNGLSLLRKSLADYVFSATSFAFPIQRALKINADLTVDMFSPEHMYTRSQDLEEAYHDAGQFYWGRPESFLEKKAIFTSSSKAVVLPRRIVQDIDTQEDWEYAHALFKAIK